MQKVPDEMPAPPPLPVEGRETVTPPEAIPAAETSAEPVPPPIIQAKPGPHSVSGLDLLAGVGIIWAVELVLGIVLESSGGLSTSGFGPVMILVTSMLGAAATFVVCWLFVCRKYGKSLVEGFAIRRVPSKTIFLSVAIGLAGAVAATALISQFGTGKSLMEKLLSTPAGFAVMVFLGLTVPPFEEIYYRGFIFPVLSRKLGVAGGILLVVVWFGSAHAFQLAKDPAALIIVVVMGLVWTLQRHLSKSLVPSIVSHWTYNAALFAVGLAERIAG